ncbi:MAG: DNA repair protein RecO [Candidatus Nomurabacteria bacterium]|nr:DNA repair protein RecO [Candidatus Nomurabacteria bacterium]
MHHIYHTDAIILGSNDFGETGKFYSIFTRELGMINATAQGIRKMSSKLRYVLQDFNYVRVDLVRGKELWRITSASKTNELEKISKSELGLKTVANISKLLKRLLQGEEQNEALFQDVLDGFYILENKLNTSHVSKEEIQNIEMVLVLRILYHLGYLGNDGKMNNFINSPFADDLLPYIAINRNVILTEINKALHETQM